MATPASSSNLQPCKNRITLKFVHVLVKGRVYFLSLLFEVFMVTLTSHQIRWWKKWGHPTLFGLNKCGFCSLWLQIISYKAVISLENIQIHRYALEPVKTDSLQSRWCKDEHVGMEEDPPEGGGIVVVWADIRGNNNGLYDLSLKVAEGGFITRV